jgi:hypothetical protein
MEPITVAANPTLQELVSASADHLQHIEAIKQEVAQPADNLEQAESLFTQLQSAA